MIEKGNQQWTNIELQGIDSKHIKCTLNLYQPLTIEEGNGHNFNLHGQTFNLKESTTNVKNTFKMCTQELHQPSTIEEGNQHQTNTRFRGINNKRKKHTQESHLGIATTIND